MIISFEEQFKAIKKKYKSGSPEAEKAAAAVHGAVVGKDGLNRHAVFTKTEDIELHGKVAHMSCATIHIARAPAGHWLMDTGCQIYYDYRGALPGIWDRKGYPSREYAVFAGVKYVLAQCEQRRTFYDKTHEWYHHYQKHANSLEKATLEYWAKIWPTLNIL